MIKPDVHMVGGGSVRGPDDPKNMDKKDIRSVYRMIKIIISPAKKMNVADDFPVEVTRPKFLEDARQLMDHLKGLTYEEQKRLWQCNDKIAGENAARLRDMDLTRRLSPAVIAYEGIQYQTMAPAVMEQKALDYLGEHLYILSGFYGLLRAFDGVTPYRLEMQAKLEWDPGKSVPVLGRPAVPGSGGAGRRDRQPGIQGIQQGSRAMADSGNGYGHLRFGELGGTSAKPGVRVKARQPRWPAAPWCGIWQSIA